MTGLAAALFAVALGAVAAFLARRSQKRFLTAPAPAHQVKPSTATAGHGAGWALTAARIGGFEAWKLLLHPVLLVGLGLSTILFFGPASEATDLASAAQDSGVVLVPFAWAAMIAANLAALRSRREGTDELIESLPTAPVTRTLGHLLSGFAASGVGVGLLVVVIVNEELFRGVFGTPNLAMLTVGPLIVLGGCFLGVLTARWVPSVIVGVLLVIATFVIEGVTGSSGTSPARWLQFWVQAVGEDGGHPFPGPVDWHVLYLVGLVGIGAAVALARHGLTRGVAALGALALLAAAAAGIAQTRQPSDSEVRRQAALYTRAPDVCETRSGVRYCVTDDSGRKLFGRWQGPVQAVLSRVPEAARTAPLLVSERQQKIVSNLHCTPTPAIELLSPRVRPLLSPDQVWPEDGDVHPDPEWPWDSECNLTDHGIVLTLQVGAWAVGLPPTQPGSKPPCRADGQARSVLALWLGAQGDPEAPRAVADVLQASRDRALGVAVAYDWAAWPNWGVAWADSDMALALDLLKLPADDVAAVVRAHWDRLVDPAATSAEFAGLAGVTTRSPLPAPNLDSHGNFGHIEDLTDRLVGSGLPSCP